MAAFHVSGRPLSLPEYLEQAGRRPPSWDGFNCLFFVADWVLAVTGLDPAAAWRGRVADERAARRILRAEGGLPVLAARTMTAAGWRETDAPGAGAVGLVQVPVHANARRIVWVPAGAICVRAALWAIKPRDGGLVMAAFEPSRAWVPATWRS